MMNIILQAGKMYCAVRNTSTLQFDKHVIFPITDNLLHGEEEVVKQRRAALYIWG